MSQPPPRSEISQEITVVSGADLNASQLYDLLHLRVDVFVVEQICPYPEIDRRDLLADTAHLWIAGASVPPLAAYLRLLTDPVDESGGPTVRRIGRVATHPEARGKKLASRLMEEALTLVGSDHVVLDAQSYLTDFYRSFGFEPTGPEYVEDGIPHVPMARIDTPTESHPESPTTGASS